MYFMKCRGLLAHILLSFIDLLTMALHLKQSCAKVEPYMDHSHHRSHAFGLRPALVWDCLHEAEVTGGGDALDEAPSPSLNVVIFHREVKWIFALRGTDG